MHYSWTGFWRQECSQLKQWVLRTTSISLNALLFAEEPVDGCLKMSIITPHSWPIDFVSALGLPYDGRLSHKYSGGGIIKKKNICSYLDCSLFCLDNLAKCRGFNLATGSNGCSCELFDEQIYTNQHLVTNDPRWSFFKINFWRKYWKLYFLNYVKTVFSQFIRKIHMTKGLPKCQTVQT